MKKIILLLCIIASAYGCTRNSSTISYTSMGGVQTFTYQGHEYLRVYHGGLIHSESCPCHGKRTLTEWETLQMAIAMTESEFKADAVGENQDCGLLQITPIYVAEVNRLAGTEYTSNDAFDIATSLEMFNTLQRYRNPDRDLDSAIHLHNKSPHYKTKVLRNYAFIQRYESVRAILQGYD